MESVSLQAAMLMPILLLQKPSVTSKSRDHSEALTRRLIAWKDGDINDLVLEGRAIQRRLQEKKRTTKKQEQTARVFAQLLAEGKVTAALRLLDRDDSGLVLPLDQPLDKDDPTSKTVREELESKHPPARQADPSALLPTANGWPTHPAIFNGINGTMIKQCTLRSSGSAGPSGLDAPAWQRLCTTFKGASTALCDALASVARRLASEFVDPAGTQAFTACRLIALDKQPGVRPIGVAEMPRRIIGKAILKIIGREIQEVAGARQLCAGHQAGAEAAIHAMRAVLDKPEVEGALLIDASNAFNNLNREVALHNVSQLCPSFSRILYNTYREESDLFVDGHRIASREGTTQGDPLAMAFYALATIPLANACSVQQLEGEAWFADDATGSGKILSIRKWWSLLEEEGPKYGYFVNAKKTWLLVKEEFFITAVQAFSGTNVRITTAGRRELGAPIGPRKFTEEFVQGKVAHWVKQLDRLTTIARSQPHAAYSALTHGLCARWTYLSRTVPNIGQLLEPIETSIRQNLLPAITGQPAPSDQTRSLFELPTRLGGMGIPDPSKGAKTHLEDSLTITRPLVSLIMDKHTDLGGAPEEQLTLKRGGANNKRQSMPLLRQDQNGNDSSHWHSRRALPAGSPPSH